MTTTLSHPTAPASRALLPTEPFEASRRHARAHGCDLAVMNRAGIGNLLMYTRLVEEYALALGRRVRLLSAPLSYPFGTVEGEEDYPVWKHNPFVAEIVDADAMDPGIMREVNRECDNFCQFGHVMENICARYGVRPRALRPALYLSTEEQVWALEQLQGLPRPVVALHPHSTTAPGPESPWHRDRWMALLDHMGGEATFLEIHRAGGEDKDLPTARVPTTIRQMFALVWACDAFIGFDSGPSHVAAAWQKPSLVVWDPIRKLQAEERWQHGYGPAVLSRWSYPQNRNLMLLGDRGNEVVEEICDWLRATVRTLRAPGGLRLDAE